MHFAGRALLTSLVFAGFVSPVYSSVGDRSDEFQQCVSQLQRQICTPPPPQNWLSFVTRWTCTDTCKYECMHAHTDLRESKGDVPFQYHGKWPFWRVLGMQEPASVLFSLINLYAHWAGAQKFRRRVPEDQPLRKYYAAYAYVSMNAWFWSAVFHTRDLPLTEKLDYFSAAATIMYALYCAVIRLFHLYPAPLSPLSPSQPRSSNLLLSVWTLICTVAYLSHVMYLSLLPRFDYSYNILANTVVGLLHNLLWVFYAIPFATMIRRFPGQPRSYRPSYVSKAGWLVLSTMLAMSLELFDFPAWRRVLDAHALWHLSTVPIAFFWYDFIIQDSLDQGWRTVKA